MGKFLLVIILFAALVYTAFWLIDRGKGPGGPGAPRPMPKAPPPRRLAPDDDEDFLRDLNRRNRQNGPDKPSD